MRQTLIYCLIGFLVLGSAFVFDLGFLNNPVLTTYRGLPPVGPLYSFYMPVFGIANLFPIFLFIAYCFYLVRIGREVNATTFLVLFLFTVLFRISFAIFRHGIDQMGVEFLVYPGEEFIYDSFWINKFGLKTFLADYTELMPKLSLHGKHFPPGNAVLIYVLKNLLGDSVNSIGWALVVLASTFILPFTRLAGTLSKSNRFVFVSASLAMLIPTSIIYGALSMDAVFAMLAIWPVYLICRALTHGNGRMLYLVSGICLGIGMLFSFSTFSLGLFLTFFLLLRVLATRDRKIVSGMIFILAGTMTALAIPYFVAGFNIYTCFMTASRANTEFMTRVVGTGLSQVHGYAAWGNYLAFGICLGFPVFGFFVGRLFQTRGRFREHDLMSSFAIALVLTMGIIGGTGIYWMETERIWLFLAFLAVLPAASLIVSVEQENSWLIPIILTFGQTFIHETLLFSLW